jgi:hypothetical protein
VRVQKIGSPAIEDQKEPKNGIRKALGQKGRFGFVRFRPVWELMMVVGPKLAEIDGLSVSVGFCRFSNREQIPSSHF